MAKQAKASYSAHIPEKWMILQVCLKESSGKCIGSDPSYPNNTVKSRRNFDSSAGKNDMHISHSKDLIMKRGSSDTYKKRFA